MSHSSGWTKYRRKVADTAFMTLSDLVGKTFQANDLYEILHFDIEQNFENYLSKFIHIYFEHLVADRIQINEVVDLADEDALYTTDRKIIGTKGWIEIHDHARHIDLMICRKDRSGKLSIIGPTIKHTQAFSRRSYEPIDRTVTLTPEEIRQAFAELAGFMDNQADLSKSKMTV